MDQVRLDSILSQCDAADLDLGVDEISWGMLPPSVGEIRSLVCLARTRECAWSEAVGCWDTGCRASLLTVTSFCPNCGGKVVFK